MRFVHHFIFQLVGITFFFVLKSRRIVAYNNIKLCWSFIFPETSFSTFKTHVLVLKSFMNLGRTLGDFLLIPWYTNKNIDRYVKTKNMEMVRKVFTEGKGIIFCTAHFGSWELSAHFFGIKEFKSTVLYTPFKTPSWLEEFAKKRRQFSGNTLRPKGKSFIALYRTLKKGKSVVLVSDQHAYPPEGMQVPLLGQCAWTHVAYIKMSLKTDVPIVPTFTYSHGMFRYTVEFTDPIYPQDYANALDPVLSMATEINQRLGAAIKRAPDLWMWQHKRFKQVN